MILSGSVGAYRKDGGVKASSLPPPPGFHPSLAGGQIGEAAPCPFRARSDGEQE